VRYMGDGLRWPVVGHDGVARVPAVPTSAG
jgi:hypothetical protein